MPRARPMVRRAVRTAMHNNASAYGYSIMCAVLSAWVGSWVGWLVAPFAASAVYVSVVSAELVFAEYVEARTGKPAKG